ncbi:MAG: ECF transporter S component [Bacillota bacterium]|nr:ECF transporter S component [Bacillota bacterium]
MEQKLNVEGSRIKKSKAQWSTKTLVRMAMFIAMSGIGAMIKIPSPTGTVALDSAAGFYVALALGFKEAAIVAALGHMFSGLTVGFSLTLPLHILIAVQMAFYVIAFRWIVDKFNLVVGVIGATILNGVLAPALFIPFFGTPFFVAMVIPLTVASFINILLATFIYKSMERKGITSNG